jgi:hypothetical protein
MAKFEDPFEEALSLDSIDEEEQKVEEEPQVAEEPAVEEKPEIPEKYRGKSIEDIAKMHQEAEKLIGKQAQEVGEVRRLADELIKREISQKKAVETPQETETEIQDRYLEDPVSAINKAVENHPVIQQAQVNAFEYKQQQVTQKLKQEFSNFDEVINDTKFFDWIKASPVRTRLFSEAHQQYDYDSAKELISTWNTMNKTDATSVADSKVETSKNLKAATVDTGSPAPSSRKVYRRSDLINLRLRDPARYEAMSDEIMAAYAEGRVK